MSPITMTFVVTNQCTAACANCSGAFNLNPEKLQFLTAQQMIDRIDEAYQNEIHIWLLCFTGGEPMLRLDDIIQVTLYARSLYPLIRITCVSNASFADNLISAKLKIQKLQAAGFTSLSLSAGFDHQKFVPIDNVVNAASIAQELGLIVNIGVEATTQSIDIYHLLKNNTKAQVDLETWIDVKNITQSKENFKPSEFSTCEETLHGITIGYDDKIKICCGQFNNFMPLLNLDNKIQQFLERTWLQKWLSVDSPFFIYSLLFPNQNLPAHKCAACFIVQNNSDLLLQIFHKFEPYVNKKFELLLRNYFHA